MGTHSISAVYSGDATNNTSTSSALSQVVNNAASATALALRMVNIAILLMDSPDLSVQAAGQPSRWP